MKLLLTSSRNPSLRVRQFMKEFSYLFPKTTIQKVNRGKKSLDQLFSESVEKYDRILLITNKQGNPNKIIGYMKKEMNFFWYFEFKIKFVKLSYERPDLENFQLESPENTEFLFENVEEELEQKLKSFFQFFKKQERIQNKNKSTFNQNSVNDTNLTNVKILLKHNEIGFELLAFNNSNKKIVPELGINEIIIEDSENLADSRVFDE
jgi:rRNA maturation protein Rpf1